MPILKSRHDHVKVYRPNGTRYATSKYAHPLWEAAINEAITAFEKEFGVLRQEEAIIEVLGVTGGWSAVVFEIKEKE